jgi:hypothetical protein
MKLNLIVRRVTQTNGVPRLTPSLAKKAVAFLRMSRSCRRFSFSRRNRFNSAATSSEPALGGSSINRSRLRPTRAHQRRKPDPKIVGDLALCAPAGPNQSNGFGLKFFRKSSLLPHRAPHPSLGTLHFLEASPRRVVKALNEINLMRVAARD